MQCARSSGVMRTAAMAVLAIGITAVVADKWSDLKQNKKQSYLDKKKRHRNLEEAKSDTEDVKKELYLKSQNKKKVESTTETFLKNERFQLCQSVDEADVKNALLKFGLVTHLFEDAQKFRKSMKALQDSIPRSNNKKKKKNTKTGMKEEKEMIREKGGPAVKLSQSNWVGRALAHLPPLSAQADYGSDPYNFNNKEETNAIWGGRERRRRDTQLKSLRGKRKGTLKVPGQVPQCHGWKYLKALDVLSDTGEVDAEVLAESVSDMLDNNFSKAVSGILETCGERLAAGGTDLCPPPQEPVEGEEHCRSQCLVNDECQFGEICCKASCGGYRCLSTLAPGKHRPCQAADQYMQCVYQMIDNQLCSLDN